MFATATIVQQSLQVFLPKLGISLLILAAGFFLARLSKPVVKKSFTVLRADGVAASYVQKALAFIIWMVAIISAVEYLGISTAGFLTMLAAVGAAVALALRENLSNLAAGLILLFTKPFKAGDFVEIENQMGIVQEIRLMHTYIDTIQNITVAVPNSTITSSMLLNYTAHPLRQCDLEFIIHFDSDLLLAKEVLVAVAKNNARILPEPAPFAAVRTITKDGVLIFLRAWGKTDLFWRTQWDLVEQVKLEFDRNGIVFARNSVDVQTKQDGSL